MKLEGIHHVTAITGDAQGNVDFYVDKLGLRLVKKTVNQDDPTVYHLFYADEKGDPGSDITFFEYPGAAGARRRRHGAPRPVAGRLGGVARLLGRPARWVARDGDTLVFSDPEGLEHALVVDESGEEPLAAQHPEIPAEHALRGFAGVRAFSGDPERSNEFLEALGFERRLGRSRRQPGRSVRVRPGAAERGVPGAGTVHHVAWASQPEEHAAWRERAAAAGARPTPMIDRFYFKSIYFREPSGVLFEIATIGPGFTADEPLEYARRAPLAAARLRASASRSSRC